MNFTDRFIKELINTNSLIIGLVSLLISILSFLAIPTDSKIDTRYLIIYIIISLVLIIICIKVAFTLQNESQLQLPKVIKIFDPPKTYKQASLLFLIEPTEIISHDSTASIYFLENDIERFLGIGLVINVQNDKKIQLVLLTNEESQEKLDALKQNHKSDISKIIVKPSIPKLFLRSFNE